MSYPRVFTLVCISSFLVVFGLGMIVPFLPLYAQDLGASETLIGVVVSSFFIVRMFMELPSGLISDRIGRRLLIVLGLLIGFFGSIICGLAVELMGLFSGRILCGVGTALFFGSCWSFIFDIFPLESKGRARG